MTREGTDPLLDAEENCSDLVELPSELEVSHAFTRRMTHLLCVMRAISKFKTLLPSRSRLHSPRFSLSPSDATEAIVRPRHQPKPPMDEQELADLKRQNEQHVVRVLRERLHALKARAIGALPVVPPFLAADTEAAPPEQRQDEPERSSSLDGSREHGEPPLQSPPPVLGIGTGGSTTTFNHSQSEPHSVVADSPTAVDFNVYDRAYEEEIERIKQNGGRPSVYLTWHLGAKNKIRGQEGEALDLLEDHQDEELAGGDSGMENGKDHSKLRDIFKPDRFADLVSQTIKDTKDKVNLEGAKH